MRVLSKIYSNELDKVEVGQLVYIYQGGEHELFKVINKSTDYNSMPPVLESVKTGLTRAMDYTSGEMFFMMRDIE